MATLKSNIILGVDTLWFSKVTEPRESIKPILELINNENKLEYSYFTANTVDELKFIITKLKVSRAGILYLASHGKPNMFGFGYGNDDYLNIKDLGELFSGKLFRMGIHISSCDFMTMHEEDIKNFLVVTRASFISGYTKTVDWMESSCADILFLNSMQLGINDVEKTAKKFVKDYSQLANRTGFVIYARGWKSVE